MVSLCRPMRRDRGDQGTRRLASCLCGGRHGRRRLCGLWSRGVESSDQRVCRAVGGLGRVGLVGLGLSFEHSFSDGFGLMEGGYSLFKFAPSFVEFRPAVMTRPPCGVNFSHCVGVAAECAHACDCNLQTPIREENLCFGKHRFGCVDCSAPRGGFVAGKFADDVVGHRVLYAFHHFVKAARVNVAFAALVQEALNGFVDGNLVFRWHHELEFEVGRNVGFVFGRGAVAVTGVNGVAVQEVKVGGELLKVFGDAQGIAVVFEYVVVITATKVQVGDDAIDARVGDNKCAHFSVFFHFAGTAGHGPIVLIDAMKIAWFELLSIHLLRRVLINVYRVGIGFALFSVKFFGVFFAAFFGGVS